MNLSAYRELEIRMFPKSKNDKKLSVQNLFGHPV